MCTLQCSRQAACCTAERGRASWKTDGDEVYLSTLVLFSGLMAFFSGTFWSALMASFIYNTEKKIT